MERLIQLLDDLDDLLAPALTVLTQTQWLRAAAVLLFTLLLARAGAGWPFAAMLSLPVLPVVDLARARARRFSPGLPVSAPAGLVSRS